MEMEMEIGLLGFNGSQGSGNGFGSVSLDSQASKQELAWRNVGFKQEGSVCCGDVYETTKFAKTDSDFSSANSILENSYSVSSDSDKLRLFGRSKPENSALPYFHQMEAAHTKNAGYYYSGALGTSSGMYLLSGVRGPFTPSQWLELEQQALIYKYMRENEPIPLHLLIPIVKAFESAGFFGFNGGSFRPTSWGMGPFHLGYANGSDPEPGRCRRTDGKKWRCARDAVVNQKYCERHMNRGRHRSRKHVEGQGNGNGHSVSAAEKSSTTTNLMPPSSSNNFDMNQHHQNYQPKGLQSLGMLVDVEKSDQGLYQKLSEELALNDRFGSSPCQSLFDVISESNKSHKYPMGPADFMSSTCSPIRDKADMSPFRLSGELEMSLGMGFHDESHKQPNWTPISYGPLGEALKTSGSCQLKSSSPTGVLQKSTFASLSNSSVGSSPSSAYSKMI